MEAIAVRRVELNKYNSTVRRALDDTIKIYRSACAEILPAVREHWGEISAIDGAQARRAFVEKLIHATKDNPKPAYPLFDLKFYKFPSYYRRAAITFVIGAYSSYMNNLKEYNERRHVAISSGKKFKEKPPRLESMEQFPVLYRKNTFNELEDGSFEIKVFIRNTWDFIRVNTPMRDKKDFAECQTQGIALAPHLVFAYGKYNLDFPMQYGCSLPKLPDIKEQRILSIDLGINCDAVCAVMRGDGTIESRYFINLASEKDCLDQLINRTRKVRRQSGFGQSLTHIYTKLQGVKENHAKQLAARIRKLAIAENVDVVVIEHLGNMCPKGDKKERIHNWRKCYMQDLLCGELHRYGIHYATVNPANTSALAFDGSGKVTRDPKNNSICTFQTGKVYNCDLNASYNIGARYFIREHLKSLGATQESQLKAKVPELVKRTTCTLATYRAILNVSVGA